MGNWELGTNFNISLRICTSWIVLLCVSGRFFSLKARGHEISKRFNGIYVTRTGYRYFLKYVEIYRDNDIEQSDCTQQHAEIIVPCSWVGFWTKVSWDSRLQTYLFQKSFPPQTPCRPQDWLHGLYDWTAFLSMSVFVFRSFVTLFSLFQCNRLSWLFVGFWAHVNNSPSYCIVKKIHFASRLTRIGIIGIYYKCSAVAEMGDRLATIDMMGRILGAMPFYGGELDHHLTQF